MATGGESSKMPSNSPSSTKAASEWKSRLLVVVADVADSHPPELSVSHYLNHIVAFANAYLVTDSENRIAVVLAHQLGSDFIHPPSSSSLAPLDHPEYLSGKQEAIASMNITLTAEIERKTKELSNQVPPSLPVSTHLSGALGQALCYIQRCIRDRPIGLEFHPRILIVKTCEDSPLQYNAVMNCIFAAQKDNVPIDSCVLWHDSSFLQQASDLTGGVYLRVPDPTGLLQYLLWICLPDAGTKHALCLPETKEVDYRAACVCHAKLVETGHVCSTCLSIFCQVTPICSVCQTHFKLPPLPLVKPGKVKGKKKKANKLSGTNNTS